MVDKNKAIGIVVEQFGVPAVSLETTFDEREADSLDAIELLLMAEDEFDVEIPDSVFEKMQLSNTVQDFINVIEAAEKKIW